MYAQENKSKENKSRAPANSVAQNKSNRKPGFGIVDNRSEDSTHRQLNKMIDRGIQRKETAQLREFGNGTVIQRGKYDDREFIGAKNTPTHVHIYNKQEGHVKVSGVKYKYGQKAEERNMRDAKAELLKIDKKDVIEYDNILGFINSILSQYDSDSISDEEEEQDDFPDMASMWKYRDRKRKIDNCLRLFFSFF